jgi:hypothetical protein
MPEVTGIELYRALPEAIPDQAARVVFIRRRHLRAARAFLEEHGGRVVHKPFRPSESGDGGRARRERRRGRRCAARPAPASPRCEVAAPPVGDAGGRARTGRGSARPRPRRRPSPLVHVRLRRGALYVSPSDSSSPTQRPAATGSRLAAARTRNVPRGPAPCRWRAPPPPRCAPGRRGWWCGRGDASGALPRRPARCRGRARTPARTPAVRPPPRPAPARWRGLAAPVPRARRAKRPHPAGPPRSGRRVTPAPPSPCRARRRPAPPCLDAP